MKVFFYLLLCMPCLMLSQNTFQDISLNTGWSIFSTYITSSNNNVESVLSNIVNELIIVKDENGNVYWPEFNLNSIGSIQPGKAYYIKLQTSQILTIEGQLSDCDSQIELNSGWNLIGCLSTLPILINDQFNYINSSLVIIKDDNGNVYWPSYSINTIINIEPGEGYQIKVLEDVNFNYTCLETCVNYNYNCDGGTWQGEVSWQIKNETGEEIISEGAPINGEICLDDGCYTVVVIDTYGDGWQGNILNIGGLVFANEDLDGCNNCGLETQIFELCVPFELISGCTDADALNYEETANIDDDSCTYPTSNLDMDLVGTYGYDETINDIWGYAYDNSEYALVGTNEGFSMVDISNPAVPIELFFIEGSNSIWRDIKTWNNYAYIVCDNCSDGLLIVDLDDLSGETFVFITDFFTSSHNIYIDENGYLYAFGGNNIGFQILDLNINPMSPTYKSINDTFYLHDGMVRGDTVWGASSQQGEIIIYDVSDKSEPLLMSSHSIPGGATHNCWISEDGNTLFTTQEYSGAYVRSYNVSDIYDIEMLDQIQSWSQLNNVVPHNTHVVGNYLVTSYYTDGVTIIDATDSYNLIEIAYFDTSPQYEGDGYYGCWGVYPFLPSGLILATDRQNGLHILSSPYSIYFNN